MRDLGVVMARSVVEERSFKEALLDLLARSLVAAVGKRDLQGSITDVKTAFSSWDNCMQAVFCKWPVIAVIVVGGLIILSVVWCVARCLCCGLSCCCECCYCLKCCGDCCGMCTPPRKQHKYLDDPYMPPHHDHPYTAHHDHPYQPPAPMTAGKAPPPMYAEFDTPKKQNGDELPQMPTWESAASKKVEVQGNAVELEQLKKPEASQNAPLMGAGAASQPPSPNPLSPQVSVGPYGQAAAGGVGAYAVARSNTDPYSRSGSGQGHNGRANTGFDQPYQEDMNRARDNQGYANQSYGNQGRGEQGYANQGYDDQGYGASAGMTGGPAMGPGRGPQRPDYNNGGGYERGGMGQGGYPQSRTPRPYDEYSNGGQSRSGTPRGGTPSNGGYGRPPPRRPTFPGNDGYGGPDRMQPSPGPQRGGYDAPQGSAGYGRPPQPGQLERMYSSDSVRPLVRPGPNRQFTDDANYPPQSPIQNNGGFDFNSGYSRPQTAEDQGPSATQQGNSGGSSYPGYRAYKPAGQPQQGGWNGV